MESPVNYPPPGPDTPPFVYPDKFRRSVPFMFAVWLAAMAAGALGLAAGFAARGPEQQQTAPPQFNATGKVLDAFGPAASGWRSMSSVNDPDVRADLRLDPVRQGTLTDTVTQMQTHGYTFTKLTSNGSYASSDTAADCAPAIVAAYTANLAEHQAGQAPSHAVNCAFHSTAERRTVTVGTSAHLASGLGDEPGGNISAVSNEDGM